jgi:hypothetical protein
MIATHFTANPFYPNDGTLVFTDTATGRRQHMPIHATTTRTEFLRLARYHMRQVLVPYDAVEPRTASRVRLQFRGDRRRNGGRWTE